MTESKLSRILNKIKEFIAKNDVVLIIALMVLICIGKSVSSYLIVGDELWNFNNAYKFYNGGGLYTDANVIITPLFYYLCMPVFKIFGATLMAFRIYNILIYTALFTLVYCLFRTLKISKIKSFTYMLIAPLMVLFSTFEIGANYNILSLVFVVSGLILYLKKINNHDKKYLFEILHGINIFLIILTKQNVGVFYTLGIVIAEFAITKNFKKSFLSLARQAIVVILLLAAFLGIMAVTNQLEGFISYTVLSIGEFGGSNVSFNTDFGTIQSIFLYSSIIIWIVSLYLLTVKDVDIFKDADKHNFMIILFVAITTFAVVYPIGNNYHFRQAFFITSILTIYFLDIVITKQFFKNEQYIALFSSIFALCLVAYSAGSFTKWINAEKETNIEAYVNIPTNQTTRDKIDTMTKYINDKKDEGIDVIIFNEKAALYNIPLKRSFGAMDLPFKGNLGKGGEDGMLETIKNLENVEILLSNGDMFWQESKKINDYIKENFEYIGPIESFYAYRNTK